MLLAELVAVSDAVAETRSRRAKVDAIARTARSGVQASSRYAGGVALRFARVRRYRPDKSPAEADTIETVRAMLA